MFQSGALGRDQNVQETPWHLRSAPNIRHSLSSRRHRDWSYSRSQPARPWSSVFSGRIQMFFQWFQSCGGRLSIRNKPNRKPNIIHFSHPFSFSVLKAAHPLLWEHQPQDKVRPKRWVDLGKPEASTVPSAQFGSLSLGRKWLYPPCLLTGKMEKAWVVGLGAWKLWDSIKPYKSSMQVNLLIANRNQPTQPSPWNQRTYLGRILEQRISFLSFLSKMHPHKQMVLHRHLFVTGLLLMSQL